MSRTHRPDNAGIHRTIQGPQRPYGKCPHCKQTKPMHWISLTSYLCYSCMKKAGEQPYHPTLAKKNTSPDIETFPKKQQRQIQMKHPHVSTSNVPMAKQRETPKSSSLRPQKQMKNAQQHKQKILTHKTQGGEKTHHQEQNTSPGATAETLARWERNRLAVEHARQQRQQLEQQNQSKDTE